MTTAGRKRVYGLLPSTTPTDPKATYSGSFSWPQAVIDFHIFWRGDVVENSYSVMAKKSSMVLQFALCQCDVRRVFIDAGKRF